MKLATRLVAALVLSLALLVTVDGYLEHMGEQELIRESVTRDVNVLGHAISSTVEEVWRSSGEERARELVEDANTGDSNVVVRWVCLDARPGEPLAPDVLAAGRPGGLPTGDLIDATVGGEPRLYAYFPVATPDGRRGAIELAQSADEITRRAARPLRRSVVQLIALFLLGTVATYVIGVRLIGRPLERLAAKIQRVGEGDLSEPLELRGSNELTDLAAGVNTMCERLRVSQAKIAEETAAKIAAIEQARHSDRLRTVGQLASGLAHELGTPLNVVSGRAALIADNKLTAEHVTESARIIGGQADRMAQIIQQLLTFARRGSATKQRINVQNAAEQTLGMLRSVAKKAGVTLDLTSRAAGDAIAECNASALQQVLANLVMNAIQASSRGDVVRVEVDAEVAAPADGSGGEARPCVRVDVRDEGEGIPSEVMSRVFEPFFTTKEVGSGTGLGLSIVHGILRDHDGWITVTSERGEGSCFTFYLPVSEA